MSHVRRFDHVGLTVADLDVVTAFFVALGLEVEGRTFVEGEFLDTVCGIPDSRTEIVMLKPPGDGTRLELSSFVRPDSVPGSPAAMANELGLRNVALARLCRARRVPGNPRLAPVETPSAIDDPITLRNSGCTGRSALPQRRNRKRVAPQRWSRTRSPAGLLNPPPAKRPHGGRRGGHRQTQRLDGP